MMMWLRLLLLDGDRCVGGNCASCARGFVRVELVLPQRTTLQDESGNAHTADNGLIVRHHRVAAVHLQTITIIASFSARIWELFTPLHRTASNIQTYIKSYTERKRKSAHGGMEKGNPHSDVGVMYQ